jgi:hypothetical protein
MQRLGRNNGRYHGETIDIEQVLREVHEAAAEFGWESEVFFKAETFELRGYRRLSPGSDKNIYLSSGIHGDEPAGPLAVQRLLAENRWPDANLWLVPCLNPTGFRLNTRENGAGIDLNRDYRDLQTAEVRAHVDWLKRQPHFHLSILLHEDWEASGFYVYELNPARHPSLAESIVAAVQAECPVETADLVDNWECRAGVIRPQVNPMERPQWAEAVWLSVHKTSQNYTLETPSDFSLHLRVKTHRTGALVAFEQFSKLC